MTLLLCFLIGIFAGLRSLTPPAATAWAARLGWLKLEGSFAFMASIPTAVIFTLLAVDELVADKLPKTPPRTAPTGLIAGIVTGEFTGACIAVAGGQGIAGGALLGAVGGVVGCFGGYQVRTRLIRALGSPDIYIALLDDLVTI